ncbi:MAG TPA: amidohydrolase [Clostridiales bacterium]|nr:amidohydrolase [Clostridiales bacterium]
MIMSDYMSDYKELLESVDMYRDLIFAAEQYIWEHPETGYREWKTSAYLEAEFERLGYNLVKAGNIPGFYTTLDTGRPGPCVLIMGELDSLICADHPDADPKTGAVHACGHHAQCAALIGLAASLKEDGALDGLSGSIRLCAVPAEELIETGYRETLREAGIIRYFGGKVEFLYRGYFDDVDMAFMIHTKVGKDHFFAYRGSNGCIVKNINYKGVASHAGGSPHEGVNALYAANLGIQAINALRETFRDSDHIRVHPIITRGGSAVNAIPNDVAMESYVRGADIKVVSEINKKVNRALAGAAASIGAGVFLSDRPGYTPLINDKNLLHIAEKAMKIIVPEGNIAISDSWNTGCTDMGDISAVMPAIHPYVGGAAGNSHGSNYHIEDHETACINSAKCQLVMLHTLLSNDAAEAKRVISEKDLRYASKTEYFKDIDALTQDKNAVIYKEDGTVILDYTKSL